MSDERRSAFLRARENIGRWKYDAVAFVREVFSVEPDEWQAEVLGLISEKDGGGAERPPEWDRVRRISMRACVGPGKSALMAWAIWWFLLCWCSKGRHPKGAGTSITGDNLKTNLWTELAHWRMNSAGKLLDTLFEQTSEVIRARDFPETWRFDAKTYSKNADVEAQGRTLSGMHADYVMAAIDESGDILPGVLKTAEQAASSARRIWILQAGNPTSLEGMLYEASQRQRRAWVTVRITGDPEDPKRSPRIPLEWAKEQIAMYGREDPWVRSNILGEFPLAKFNALLSMEDVEAALRRVPPDSGWKSAPKVLGVDVARQGDDASVICPRQGVVVPTDVLLPKRSMVVARGLDSIAGGGLVARHWSDWQADAAMIDNATFGAGWCDQLEMLGFAPMRVEFGSADRNSRYKNKRAEMWWNMAQWVKQGGCLPPDQPELVAELTETTYTYVGDKILIERKEDLKRRLKRSPDRADALALTFAHPVAPKEARVYGGGRAVTEYDALTGSATGSGGGRAVIDDPWG